MVHAVALGSVGDFDSADIYLRAEPNGLAFAPSDHALYVVDAHGGALLRVNGDRREWFASIPLAGGDRLAAIAVTPHGTIYVTRVGNDHAGAVFEIDRDGREKQLELPTAPWRLGLAYDSSEHALYCTEFVKPPGKPFEGSLTRVDLASGVTTTLLDRLEKPVGIAKLGPILIACDACRYRIHELDLDDSSGPVISRAVPARPDSLCSFDGRSVLLTTFDRTTHRGALCQIWLDGRTRTLATGTWEPRGVASDGRYAYVSVRRGGRVLVIPIES